MIPFDSFGYPEVNFIKMIKGYKTVLFQVRQKNESVVQEAPLTLSGIVNGEETRQDFTSSVMLLLLLVNYNLYK